jgi:hypothetical protein
MCGDAFRGDKFMLRLVALVATQSADYHPELMGVYFTYGDASREARERLHRILFEPDFTMAAALLIDTVEENLFPLDWATDNDVAGTWVWSARLDGARVDTSMFTDKAKAGARWSDYNYMTYNLAVLRTHVFSHLAQAWQDARTPSIAHIEAAYYEFLGQTYDDIKDNHQYIGADCPYGLSFWNDEWFEPEGPCSAYPGTTMGMSVDVVLEMAAAHLEGKTSLESRVRLGRVAMMESPLPGDLARLWVTEATAALAENEVDATDPTYKPDPMPRNFEAMSAGARAVYLLSREGRVPFMPLYPPVGTYTPECVYEMTEDDEFRHDRLTEAIADAFELEIFDIPPAEVQAAASIQMQVGTPSYTDNFRRKGRTRGRKDAEHERAAGEFRGAKTDIEHLASSGLTAIVFMDLFEIPTRARWRELREKLVANAQESMVFCVWSDKYEVWSDHDLDNVPAVGSPDRRPWRHYIKPNVLKTICREGLPDTRETIEDIDIMGTTENPTRAGLHTILYILWKAFPRTSIYRDFLRIAMEMAEDQPDMIYQLGNFWLCFILGRLPTSNWTPPFDFVYHVYETEGMIGSLCGVPDTCADLDQWKMFFLQPIPQEDSKGRIPNGRGGHAPPNAFVQEDIARLRRDRRKAEQTESGKNKPRPPALSKVFRPVLCSYLKWAAAGTPMEKLHFEQNKGMEMTAATDATVDLMAQMVHRNWILGGVRPMPYDKNIEDGWVLVEHVAPVKPYDGLFTEATSALSNILPLMFEAPVDYWGRVREAIKRIERKTDEENLGGMVAQATVCAQTEEEYRHFVTTADVPLKCGPNFVSYEAAEYMRRFIMTFRAHQVPSWLWLRAFPVRTPDGKLRVVRMEVVSALMRLQDVVEAYEDVGILPRYIAYLADIIEQWEWELIRTWVDGVYFHQKNAFFPLLASHAQEQRNAYVRQENFRHEGAMVDPDRKRQSIVEVCPACGVFLSEVVTTVDDAAHSTTVGPIGVSMAISPVTNCLTPGCRGPLPSQWKQRLRTRRVQFGPHGDLGKAVPDRTKRHIMAKEEKTRREALQEQRCMHIYGGVSGGVLPLDISGGVLVMEHMVVMACMKCTRNFVVEKCKFEGSRVLCQHCVGSPAQGRPVWVHCANPTCASKFDINDRKKIPTWWATAQSWDEGAEKWVTIYICRSCTKVTRPRKYTRGGVVNRPYEGMTRRLVAGLTQGGPARVSGKRKDPVLSRTKEERRKKRAEKKELERMREKNKHKALYVVEPDEVSKMRGVYRR